MTDIISIAVEAPPATVNVLVDFYDDNEKEAFLASPLANAVKEIPKTLAITTTDLLAYYLYYKRALGVPGYGSHEEIALKWWEALVEFSGQLEFSGSSLRRVSQSSRNRGTTERVGEAIGMSVASNLHSLHQADWGRIPESNRKKTLDFWHPWTASTEKDFIQLEAKGSAPDGNNNKSSSISQHKKSIKAKKGAATPDERKESALYGTIGVLDERRDSVARCWLVDPPSNVSGSPERFKVVTRLTYISRLISLLAPRSSLATAAENRIRALTALDDTSQLDQMKLVRATGEPFDDRAFAVGGRHNQLFSNQCVVTDGPAVGRILLVDRSHFMFIGMQERLISYAVRQDFRQVAQYNFKAGTIKKELDCIVSSGRFDREFARYLQIPGDSIEKNSAYVRFRIQGLLNYTQSGLVFGVLPIPEHWQR